MNMVFVSKRAENGYDIMKKRAHCNVNEAMLL